MDIFCFVSSFMLFFWLMSDFSKIMCNNGKRTIWNIEIPNWLNRMLFLKKRNSPTNLVAIIGQIILISTILWLIVIICIGNISIHDAFKISYDMERMLFLTQCIIYLLNYKKIKKK